MTFTATVIPSGNATAVEVPREAIKSLGSAPRPPVVIEINGHRWRSRIAIMRGTHLIGISRANRAAAGIAEGDRIDVSVEIDSEPRVVDVPGDLARELDRTPEARAAFDALPFGLRKKHVRSIEEAKGDATRTRRIAKLISSLPSPTKRPTSGASPPSG